MKHKRAFTLVELLAVIAIIAVLAAILFPVFAQAKVNAMRKSDFSGLSDIGTALKLYKEDNGAYPPALLGYASTYSSGPNIGQVMPANLITGFLYPKRVQSFISFQSKKNDQAQKTDIVTNVVWPAQDARAVGTAPQVDTNGDGALTAADDTLGTRQAYGPTTVVLQKPGFPASPTNQPVKYYKLSAYDVQTIPTGGGNTRNEIHYALFWSNYSIGTGAGFGQGSSFDDPRQLGYADPPDDTLVLWSSWFRNVNTATGVPNRERNDMVLFLAGNVRYFDSRDLYDYSWRIRER